MKTTIIMVVGLACSWAAAGPEWIEAGDAGPVPGSAQSVTGGGGPVTKIIGDLYGPSSMPHRVQDDFQDMYLIYICDPIAFRATTLPAYKGFADFDPSMWLFSADGSGLLANLDAGPGEPNVFMLNEATDATGSAVLVPGLYYLAISGAGSVPVSDPGGLDIFHFIFPGEVSGPDGPGGMNPITGWSGPGQWGHYEIALWGVCTIVPAPGVLGLLSSFGLVALRRRR
ncbi:MAG: DVUA0089 family protein [Phycisphaerales bacterium]|nr:DVUA0089 family protein [Phycisphaerales bacterium]